MPVLTMICRSNIIHGPVDTVKRLSDTVYYLYLYIKIRGHTILIVF
jgi:hypothetical protein